MALCDHPRVLMYKSFAATAKWVSALSSYPIPGIQRGSASRAMS